MSDINYTDHRLKLRVGILKMAFQKAQAHTYQASQAHKDWCSELNKDAYEDSIVPQIHSLTSMVAATRSLMHLKVIHYNFNSLVSMVTKLRKDVWM